MWDGNLARLQAVLIDNVLLGRDHEPDSLVVKWGFIVGLVVVSNKSLLGRRLLLFHLLRFNVSQKRRRSFGNLQAYR